MSYNRGTDTKVRSLRVISTTKAYAYVALMVAAGSTVTISLFVQSASILEWMLVHRLKANESQMKATINTAIYDYCINELHANRSPIFTNSMPCTCWE
jgi:hypothetical protein